VSWRRPNRLSKPPLWTSVPTAEAPLEMNCVPPLKMLVASAVPPE
jgi:hypothetical protein